MHVRKSPEWAGHDDALDKNKNTDPDLQAADAAKTPVLSGYVLGSPLPQTGGLLGRWHCR